MVNAVEINKQISIIFTVGVEDNNILKPCDSYNPRRYVPKEDKQLFYTEYLRSIYYFVNHKVDQNFSL